jgi:kynureninase
MIGLKLLRDRALELDERDVLAKYKDEYELHVDDTIYMDGNSLGQLSKSARSAVIDTLDLQWGRDKVAAWDRWLYLCETVGNAIGSGFLGAEEGEVIVSDSTSVNLYKLAVAAVSVQKNRGRIVTDDQNFPTDRYILAGIAEQMSLELTVVHSDRDGAVTEADLAEVLDEDVALVSLSHVNYRSGGLSDMREINRAVHGVGAFSLWDLSHSVGVVPIDLDEEGCDLAVGCTYKYLNGGPGSPAFLYIRDELIDKLSQPIWGWFSTADQFEMGDLYLPKDGVGRFQVGTPPILSVAALSGALEPLIEATISAIREKSLSLTTFAQELIAEWLHDLGFMLASPSDPNGRGGHISLYHKDAREINDHLVKRYGVITDYRVPDRIRFTPSPMYTSFTMVYDALERLRKLAMGMYKH